MTLSGRTIVAAAKEPLSADLGGEATILNLSTGIYYGLNAVGSTIWTLLQEPRTVEAIRNAVLAEYDVEPERCERDLHALLTRLIEEGLVEVRGEEAPES